MMPAGLGEHLAAQSRRVFAHLLQRLEVANEHYSSCAGRSLATEIRFVKTGTPE